MKRNITLLIILGMLVTPLLAGCNLPKLESEITPTSTATAIPPSPTLAPPTDTPPPPPTDTPQPSPTTAVLALPSPIPATPTRHIVPTAEPIKPEARAKFVGTFDSGTISFRISEKGNMVIPKTVSVKGATCKGGGKKISDTVNFNANLSYQITDGKFTITIDAATISGQFVSAKKAIGTVTLTLKVNNQTCTIGPESWAASAE